jgi:hypothetical protein
MYVHIAYGQGDLKGRQVGEQVGWRPTPGTWPPLIHRSH